MLTIIIGVILIALICYFGFVFYQRHTIKMATEVYEEKKKLKNIPLDEEFELAHKLNLTGDSQKKYKNLLDKYQRYTTQMLPDIDSKIKTVKENGNGINFVKNRRDWNSANSAINEADDTLKEIQADLAQLHDLDKQHHLAVTDLENKYKQLRKTMLDENESFGPGIDGLENALSNIETTFGKFTNFTNHGDPNAAENVLNDLNNMTSKLEGEMKIIPQLYHDLAVNFNDQVSEIEDNYEELRSQSYNFKNDAFKVSISKIRREMRENIGRVKALNVGLAQKTNNDIEDQINGLYDKLEAEMTAKHAVDKNSVVIQNYLNHLKKQNNDISAEIKNLSLHYMLNHGEVENNHQFTGQIKNEIALGENIQQTIDNGNAIYSEVQATQKTILTNLVQIEKGQRDLHKAILELPKQEKQVSDTLAKYDLQMRTMKRRITKLNLPGLPKDYSDSFVRMISELRSLDKAISRPQISIDDIEKKLDTVQEDMTTMQGKTDTLVDNAVLSEQAMQFSNRYINSNIPITKALGEAKQSFDNDYDYEASLRIISDVLEKEKPGSFKKIKDAYLSKQTN